MPSPLLNFRLSKLARSARFAALTLAVLSSARYGIAQDTPLLSGGVGFFTSTTAGQTSYLPEFEPLLSAPIGQHFLVESRAILLESFAPNGGDQPGYDHTHFIGLTYLQGDYILSPHVTIVGGSFLLPFNTYNDRLSPIWISNFQAGPLIAGLGLLSTGVGTGGMLSGSAISRRKYSISYNAFFSSRVDNQYFEAKRSAGARASLYLPDKGLEIGVSYDRQLQGTQENFYGAHVWWEPKNSGFQLRSEFARGQHAQGYWIETAYRTQAFGGFDSLIGRIEPVFRMNQSFHRDTLMSVASDGLPLGTATRVDVGLDYNLPHNTRILTSYSRQASSASSPNNENIWQTGIVYRFLFPAWKGK
jgi:hypothetical protein